MRQSEVESLRDSLRFMAYEDFYGYRIVYVSISCSWFGIEFQRISVKKNEGHFKCGVVSLDERGVI